MRIAAYYNLLSVMQALQKKSFTAAGNLVFCRRFLNWRAIAVPGLEACPAALAHIEKHARVCRHGLRCAMPASRACNRRDELHHTSQELSLPAELGQSKFNRRSTECKLACFLSFADNGRTHIPRRCR